MDPRYPIGKFVPPAAFDAAGRAATRAAIAGAPAALRAAVAGLDDAQLDTPYRDGGWTVRQVTHHVADSHVNAYVRFKLAVTEERPTIRPYDEALWAECGEAKRAPVELSLALLDAVHARWIAFLDTLAPADYAREYFHPQQERWRSVDWGLAMYAWHGRHHAAHVLALRRTRGW